MMHKKDEQIQRNLQKTCYEEVLEQKGILVYTNVGDSMRPLLRPKRDIIQIQALPKYISGVMRVKRYDAVLFKTRDKYILHRVLRVKKDGTYIIAGDNCAFCEKGIRDNQILGVLVAVKRDGKVIPVDFNKERRKGAVPPLSYRLYVHLICDFFVLRKILFIARSYAYAFRRKLYFILKQR